jgi:hypothetical protein
MLEVEVTQDGHHDPGSNLLVQEHLVQHTTRPRSRDRARGPIQSILSRRDINGVPVDGGPLRGRGQPLGPPHVDASGHQEGDAAKTDDSR